MKLLLLSDIHGNSFAFHAVLNHAAQYPDIGACILLGDLIDYGMHSNEVLQMARALPYPILCNIHGNHENAILNADYSRFSSERGRDSARYTRSILNEESWDYLRHEMTSGGKKSLYIMKKSVLPYMAAWRMCIGKASVRKRNSWNTASMIMCFPAIPICRS